MELSLGNSIPATLPLVFSTFQTNADPHWVEIAQIGDQSEVQVEFLIYSNVELLDVYFRENLWSTDYYTQKEAE